MNRIAFAALAATLLVGCPEDGKTDSGDTDTDTTDTTGCPTTFSGPVTVQEASASCTGDVVTIDVLTEGWTSGGTVYQIQSTVDAWADEHDLESYEYDPCGEYDRLARELATTTTLPTVRNESTLFACASYSDGTMTWAVAVTDLNGDMADCLAWGDDPQGVIDGTRLSTFNYEDGPTFDESMCVVGAPAR